MLDMAHYKACLWCVRGLLQWKPLSILPTKNKLKHVFSSQLCQKEFSLIKCFGNLLCYLGQYHISYLILKESIRQKFSDLFASPTFSLHYSKFSSYFFLGFLVYETLRFVIPKKNVSDFSRNDMALCSKLNSHFLYLILL